MNHPTTTIGTRLDSYLAQLDSLSSTQLYGIIVVVTVAVSFLLLGSGHDDSATANVTVLLEQPKKQSKQLLAGPQPKWHILKWLNVLACLTFVVSVVHFVFHMPPTNTSLLLIYLVGWSLFLCYFFGFFGISFVQTEELAAMAAAQQQQQQQGEQQTRSVQERSCIM
jgi:hypothetical protein